MQFIWFKEKFWQQLKKDGFQDLSQFLINVLTLLGYESYKSFSPLADASLETLYEEIENFIKKLDLIEGHVEEKKVFTNEVMRLWQTKENFKLPSGHKNSIISIRDYCALKSGLSSLSKKAKITSQSLQTIQSAFLEKANRNLSLMPENLRETTNSS